MKKIFLTDFGFQPKGEKPKGFEEIELGPKKTTHTKFFWTALIYIFFSSGIFFRRTVVKLDPLPGVNTAVFKIGIIAASFIIGLALLAPLLRVISKFHKGQLSWQHCLTAFSIGFFGDLTFDFLINNFVNRLPKA
jgi:hypothetical protein